MLAHSELENRDVTFTPSVGVVRSGPYVVAYGLPSFQVLAIVAMISLFSQHCLLPNPTLEFTLFVVLEGDSRGDNHSETTVYHVHHQLESKPILVEGAASQFQHPISSNLNLLNRLRLWLSFP